MSLQECANTLGIAEATLKYSLKRTQDNFRKRGLIITKTGHGNKAQYDIKRVGE